MHILLEPLDAIFKLFFPKLCVACHHKPPINKNLFCLSCQLDLPFTDQIEIQNNELELKILGRFPFKRGAALFRFKKDSKVQDIIHQIKYQNRPQIAESLGRKFGSQLLKTENFDLPDVIVPIPLHFSKFRQRGYNQSEEFARGISEVTAIPILNKTIKKIKHTDSQTEKSRGQRLANVADSFVLKQGKKIEGKHILLVDDVITTGATLEAAAQKLLQASQVSLSLACIAMAEI